jgi:hypothetical protein
MSTKSQSSVNAAAKASPSATFQACSSRSNSVLAMAVGAIVVSCWSDSTASPGAMRFAHAPSNSHVATTAPPAEARSRRRRRWHIDTIGVGAMIRRNRTGEADDDRSVRTGGAITEQRAASPVTCVACRASTSVTPVSGCTSDVEGRRPGRGRASRAGPAEGRAYGVRRRDDGEHRPTTATSRTLTARTYA